MSMRESNWADLLEPGLRAIFNNVLSRPAPVLTTLFNVVPSRKLQEHYTSIGALGLVPLFEGTVEYEKFNQGYKTTITNYELAKGVAVERALIDDDQYGEIERRARSLGDSFAFTREHDAAQVFINAFTDSGNNRMGASVAGPDSVALCSTAHPRSPSDTSNTQSNEGTYTLTYANVDTVRRDMMDLTDDKGNLLGITPDLCLIPTELETDARKIFDPRAVWEPGSAQFDVNIFNGNMRVVVWNRLTDANAWFLIDTAQMRRHLIFQNRIAPEFNREKDFDTLVAKYMGYMRYGIGFDDWRWINGQNPS